MKSYAPTGLHAGMLRELITDMGSTPAKIAKLLRVTERSIWRWMADDSAPYAVILALWHESPRGHYNRDTDLANHNAILHALVHCKEDTAAQAVARLAKLLAISSTGAANDPFLSGPVPAARVEGVQQVAQHIIRGTPAPPVHALEAFQPLAQGPLLGQVQQ